MTMPVKQLTIACCRYYKPMESDELQFASYSIDNYNTIGLHRMSIMHDKH